MGKTYTRNPDSENYSGNVRRTRKQRKQERLERHKDDVAFDRNMEDADYGDHSTTFKPKMDN